MKKSTALIAVLASTVLLATPALATDLSIGFGGPRVGYYNQGYGSGYRQGYVVPGVTFNTQNPRYYHERRWKNRYEDPYYHQGPYGPTYRTY